MRILITGGSGSLGVALVSALQAQGHTCTIYSRDEVKQSDMRVLFPYHRYVLGDVRDLDWLRIVMNGHDVVIHAAAYKQVPSAEVNVGEAIETNVIGSRNVARAAVENGIPRVIGISTDKACAPINAYGETKALMEKLFQSACSWGDTKFNLVRYGNVLGSRGSVVPFFKSRLDAGLPLLITDAHMTRFWLTMNDAVELVLRAMQLTAPGVILVPKARASRMGTLAEAVVLRYNAPTDALFETKTIGVRPGEKIHESLIHAGESMHAYEKHGYFYIHRADTPNFASNLPLGFEYTSDTATQLSTMELAALL